MSTAMMKDFKFVNITGGEYSELVDVTRTTVVSDYQPVTKILGNDAINQWLKIQEKDNML